MYKIKLALCGYIKWFVCRSVQETAGLSTHFFVKIAELSVVLTCDDSCISAFHLRELDMQMFMFNFGMWQIGSYQELCNFSMSQFIRLLLYIPTFYQYKLLCNC